MIDQLTNFQWVFLAFGALTFGLSKSAVAGFGVIGVIIFAIILPGKQLTAAIVPLALIADASAGLIYRKHANWKSILTMLPFTILGLVVGWLILDKIDDWTARKLIGIIILSLCSFHFWRNRQKPSTPTERPVANVSYLYGLCFLFGLTSSLSNAGGPLLLLSLLTMNLSKLELLGTQSCFCLITNGTRIPLLLKSGLMNHQTLHLSLVLTAATITGFAIGWKTAQRLNQKSFENISLVFSILGGLKLVFL